MPRPDGFRSALVCANHGRARADRNAGCGQDAMLSEDLRRFASEGRKIDLVAAQRMLDGVAPDGASRTCL
jgi:hypothetical protein